MKNSPAQKQTNKILLLITGFIFCLPLINQAQIQGKYHDTYNEPILFATILLINENDSALVTGVQGTEEGTFSITNFKPGKYLIKASAVGYKTVVSKPFEIISSKDHYHVEPLIAREDVTHLAEVEVIAKKPIYEQQVDRLVINVEKSITSAGTTALEVLEKSPGVNVNRQNKSILLGGREGVVVMINGKESRMPVSAAIEMLNVMSSENVKKIELITTPPAKYEAEGDAGIINIVLKKDDDFGTNGTYTLGAGLGADGKLNGSITLNHHVNKINIFGTYSYSYDNTYQEFDMWRQTQDNGSVYETNSQGLREPVINFHNVRFGFDYTVSSKTVIGFLGTGYSNDWKLDALNLIDYSQDGLVTSKVNQYMEESNVWTHYMGNFNLQHTFAADKVLEINLDYLHYYDDNPSHYDIHYLDGNSVPTSEEEIAVTKNTPIEAMVGKIDYNMPLGSGIKMESGLKSTFSKFENDVSVANKTEDDWVYDDFLTNQYDLNESIYAAYSSFNFKIKDKTTIVAGLRFEYSNTDSEPIAYECCIVST